ncbi:MAG: hypothetical protein NTW52_06450 [Planctomycetota bacterium]|nr:hypothetical protein [Planctomycetota bacterium]
MSTRLKSIRIDSRAFWVSASAIAATAVFLGANSTTCFAQQISTCGCEVVEPSCGAPACDVPCAAKCDAASSDATGCDGCGKQAYSARRYSLPGIGEGLLAGLDKMTDRFEHGMGKLISPRCRPKSTCDLCSGSLGCQCQSEGLDIHSHSPASASSAASSSVDEPQKMATSDSKPASDSLESSDGEPVVPPSPVEMNSADSNATETESGNDIPVKAPLAPATTPKSEAQGNPFIDEARTRPRNLPEIHVAKVQTSIRGSTRRRYSPQSQPSVIEAVAPEQRSLPDVVTAGALQQNRTSANVYAR